MRMQRPATGNISSGFGYRTPGAGSTYHQGVDFSWMRADRVQDWNIYAAADGVVIFAGVSGGYGNLTRIDHGSSIETRYGHQARFHVKRGDRVRAGQIIGVIGNTGRSGGAHLHFEVLVRGVRVDPMPYFTAPAGGGSTPITPTVPSITGAKMYLLFDTNGVGMLVTENGTTGIETPEHYNLLARVIRSNQANAKPETMWPAEVATVDMYLRRAAGKPTATIDEAALARALDAVIDDEAILAAVKAIVPGGSGAPVDLTKVLEAIAANTAAIAATPDAVRKALKDAL